MVGLVQKRKQPGEDTDAVEGVSFWRELRVGERGVVAEHAEARGDGENQRLEVCEIVVARAADICRREERKDIFGGFGQLPELVQQLARVASSMQGEGCHTPVQYASSAGTCLGSDRRKMPCLKLSFESDAPIGKHITISSV